VRGDSITIGSEGQGEDSKELSLDMGHLQFTCLARDVNRGGGPTSRKKLVLGGRLLNGARTLVSVKKQCE
jgi:hypothetical protein